MGRFIALLTVLATFLFSAVASTSRHAHGADDKDDQPPEEQLWAKHWDELGRLEKQLHTDEDSIRLRMRNALAMWDLAKSTKDPVRRAAAADLLLHHYGNLRSFTDRDWPGALAEHALRDLYADSPPPHPRAASLIDNVVYVSSWSPGVRTFVTRALQDKRWSSWHDLLAASLALEHLHSDEVPKAMKLLSDHKGRVSSDKVWRSVVWHLDHTRVGKEFRVLGASSALQSWARLRKNDANQRVLFAFTSDSCGSCSAIKRTSLGTDQDKSGAEVVYIHFTKSEKAIGELQHVAPRQWRVNLPAAGPAAKLVDGVPFCVMVTPDMRVTSVDQEKLRNLAEKSLYVDEKKK